MIFMTDFVKLSLSTDNVETSEGPAKWNINGLAKIGIVIGILMTLEAFGLLYFGLKYFELSEDNHALSTFTFEILLFFALFSIFVVREKNHFWHSAPSKMLLFIILADMVLGVVFSSFGLLGLKEIPSTLTFIVISYTAVFSFIINDLIKVVLLKKWHKNIANPTK
jgi:H+-transporting ATPase